MGYFDADAEKQYVPIVQSMDEAFTLLSFRQYENLGLPIDLTDVLGSLDAHQEWFESLETLDKALTLDSVGALPIENQWVLEAEMKTKGQVKTMSGKPHKPRKLIQDKNITPEEAAKKLKFEASGKDYLWVDWRDGKVMIAANHPTRTSMHVCWVYTPDSPTPFQSTMEGLSNWLILTGKTIPANLIRNPTELDFFITSSTVLDAQATAQELEDCDWPYLLVDDGLPGMIKISYDDNLTDYAEDPNNWVIIDSKTSKPVSPPPKGGGGNGPPPPPPPPPPPISPTPSPGPLSNLFDAEFREEEVLWKQDFHTMLFTGTDKIFFAFRDEEPGVVYTIEQMSVKNQPMCRILHIWEPYSENKTPYDSYIQKLIIEHDLLSAEPDDDLEPEPWADPTEPWMEDFAAPEGICLFCDETEGLEVINLDGHQEELCETCRDPEQYVAEDENATLCPHCEDAEATEICEWCKGKECKECFQDHMVECNHCDGEGEIPRSWVSDSGDRWNPPTLDVTRYEDCEYCNEGQVCAEEDVPYFSWDAESFSADMGRAAGYNISPYSDQEIADFPSQHGIVCSMCGYNKFKKSMATYNKVHGTTVYYPCNRCDHVQVAIFHEPDDVYRVWGRGNFAAESFAANDPSSYRGLLLKPANHVGRGKICDAKGCRRVMKHWRRSWGIPYYFCDLHEAEIDKTYQAESFAAVETQTGVIVGDYTVSWITFVMKIGTGPPEKLIRTTQRREFDDIDKARKYCELLMDNGLTYEPMHKDGWQAISPNPSENEDLRWLPEQVKLMKGGTFAEHDLPEFVFINLDSGALLGVTPLHARNPERSSNVAFNEESFEATTSPAGTKGSGMSRLKADAIINKVKAHMGPHLDFIEVCGSYRRGNSTPKDLDFVVIPKKGVTLPNILPPNQGVNWVGDKKAQVVIDNETIDFHASSLTGLGAALMYFTGPAGYNIGMRMRAKKMGLKLNEYGVFDRNTGAYIAGATEADVYQALGKPYKSPDLRGK